jgi:hypothetical protein
MEYGPELVETSRLCISFALAFLFQLDERCYTKMIACGQYHSL